MKGIKKNQHNSNFNISKYNNVHHNQSLSPASQTFFIDPNKSKNLNNSLIGKKGQWPTLKKKTNVSPYSKNNQKVGGPHGQNIQIQGYHSSNEQNK